MSDHQRPQRADAEVAAVAHAYQPKLTSRDSQRPCAVCGVYEEFHAVKVRPNNDAEVAAVLEAARLPCLVFIAGDGMAALRVRTDEEERKALAMRVDAAWAKECERRYPMCCSYHEGFDAALSLLGEPKTWHAYGGGGGHPEKCNERCRVVYEIEGAK